MQELQQLIYVEDETDIRTVAQMALEMIGGFDLKLFESGQLALAHLQQQQPQLILLDVMMPGMDGPTTLAELRKLPNCADIPVVFMTAKAQPNEVAQFKALGAIDVIAKPFDPMTLPDQVRTIWQHYQQQR